MKTMNSLLLAGAVALGFTLTITAKAGEPFLSPKARANQTSRVSGADSGLNLVSNNYLGAAARTELSRARVVPDGTVTPNLVSGNYLGTDTKNPFPKSASFEIAPLACKDMPGMAHGSSCTMACCAKK